MEPDRTASPRPAGRSRQAGFVLSELVLVVTLVTALLVVVIVSVNGIHRDTRRGECQTELRNLKVATERYLAESGKYPASKAAVIAKKYVTETDVANWSLSGLGADGRPIYRAEADCA
ncbi:MAG: hypothetical protein JWM89_3365 [Acidimicrobiales bacterium]|nr:hypothetical protein [Acidimicrobiales bacterium]